MFYTCVACFVKLIAQYQNSTKIRVHLLTNYFLTMYIVNGSRTVIWVFVTDIFIYISKYKGVYTRYVVTEREGNRNMDNITVNIFQSLYTYLQDY